MSTTRRNTSFRKGFIVGAIAGAGAMLWNAPQSGARTREQAMELFESALFQVLDMPLRLQSERTVASVVPSSHPAVLPGTDEPNPLLGADIVLDGPRPVEFSHPS